MKMAAVPKDAFPRLLTRALQKMDAVQAKQNAPFSNETSGIKRNMRSAFKASGIFPLNRDQVLKRLPQLDENTNPDGEIESVLTDYLREQRFGGSASTVTKRKRTRLNVVPGASVTTKGTECNEQPPNTYEENSESDPEEPTNAPLEEETSEDAVHMQENDEELCIGRYVLAKFFTARGKKTYRYVCQITETLPCIVVVGYKSLGDKKKFKLVKDDISDIDRHDIIAFLPEPKAIETQGSNFNVEYPFEVDILEF